MHGRLSIVQLRQVCQRGTDVISAVKPRYAHLFLWGLRHIAPIRYNGLRNVDRRRSNLSHRHRAITGNRATLCQRGNTGDFRQNNFHTQLKKTGAVCMKGNRNSNAFD